MAGTPCTRAIPRLIYAAASGFGHTGPYSHYPAYDMVVQGLGGIMSITGHPGMPLTRVGTSVGDLAGGLYTAIALNAALLHRERTGEATKVDVALVRLPAGAPRKRDHALHDDRRDPRADGRAPPLDHPVRGVRDRGRPHHHRRRQ